MIHYDRPSQVLAAVLAALAGYVDALGFIHLGGYFASFMSGNSTRMAVGLVRGSSDAAVAAALIGTFVLGVMLGALAAHWGRARRAQTVLALVASLLATAAAFAHFHVDRPAVAAMVLAMGAENAVFQRNGDVAIGLTYMTGSLVKLGQRLTAALLGGDRMAWVPYLMLWLGLIVGALGGACAYPTLGLQGLWIAAGAAVMLAFVAGGTTAGSGDHAGEAAG